MRVRIFATRIWRCETGVGKKGARTQMTRSLSARRNSKPTRPAYILEDQIGFILRQVWQRHATIFTKEIGNNLTPTQWAAMSKLSRNRTVLAEPARAPDRDGCRHHQGRDRPAHRPRPDRDQSRPEDGRRLLVSLTRAGQQLAEKAVPNALAITKETLAPLDARERETLVALLSKLR